MAGFVHEIVAPSATTNVTIVLCFTRQNYHGQTLLAYCDLPSSQPQTWPTRQKSFGHHPLVKNNPRDQRRVVSNDAGEQIRKTQRVAQRQRVILFQSHAHTGGSLWPGCNCVFG